MTQQELYDRLCLVNMQRFNDTPIVAEGYGYTNISVSEEKERTYVGSTTLKMLMKEFEHVFIPKGIVVVGNNND